MAKSQKNTKSKPRRGEDAPGRVLVAQRDLVQLYPPPGKAPFSDGSGNLTAYSMPDESGNHPVVSYISEQMSRSERARFITTMTKVDQQPGWTSHEHWKKLEGESGLFEYKQFKHRLLGFFDGRGRFVFASAEYKKKNKLRNETIDRAKRLRKRYEQGR